MTKTTGGGGRPPIVPVPHPPSGGVSVPVPPEGKLLQASDLVLVGSFRVPPGSKGVPAQSASYGGTALCYWPAHGTLVMCGHDHHQWITEFDIPTPIVAATVADLPRANEVQPYTDILQDKLYSVDGGTGNGVKVGGITLRSADESIVVNVWTYYDNAVPPQMKTHFRVGKWDWSQLTPDDVAGPFQVGTGFTASIEGSQADHDKRVGGFVSGYQCVIPDAWQPAFDGMGKLTGHGGGVSILTRTSSGPSCSAYDILPDGVTDPVPATMLMGYPSDSSNQSSAFHHPTLGDWGIDGSGLGLYNGTEVFRGMAWPDDTASVLFVGWRGTSFCYGPGVSDPALHMVALEPPQYDSSGDPVHSCYDPTNDTKGTHGYPNEACIYAYDANDLLAVKQGTKTPWDVVPYATWRLDYPFEQNFPHGVKDTPYMTMGAAWDRNRRWLFVSGYRQDGDCPVIHVFQVA